jgi:hypothetical protein
MDALEYITGGSWNSGDLDRPSLVGSGAELHTSIRQGEAQARRDAFDNAEAYRFSDESLRDPLALPEAPSVRWGSPSDPSPRAQEEAEQWLEKLGTRPVEQTESHAGQVAVVLLVPVFVGLVGWAISRICEVKWSLPDLFGNNADTHRLR